MAGASTLHSLLFKLGFDTSGLASGSGAARSELRNVANAARELQSAAAPVASTMAAIGSASQKTAGNLSQLVSAEQAATAAMKAQYAAAGPLVSAQEAVAQANMAASASSGGLVTASQAAANALKAQYAAAGPLVTSLGSVGAAQAQTAAGAQTLASAQQIAANALRAANQAAGPLVMGFQGANGAMQAMAPAANLAAVGFQAVGGGANQAAAGMGNAANAAPRMINMMKQTSMAAQEVGGAASFMQRTLSMAFAFSGGVAVTNIISFVGNALIGFNSRLEQAHIAFGTLLGDGAAGDKFIEQMQKFANFTPFDFAGVEDAAQRFLAMGMAADQVLPALNAIGDAVAALGGGKEKLDRVTLAIGQMTTAGRVNAQDMRQLTEAGIPAWQILADSIGKSVAETRKLAEQGLIPAGEAVAALLNGMETNFSGMMARQARTAQGAFSTIRDAAYQTISAAVQPLFAAISKGMVALADFFTSGGGKYVAPVIYGIGTALAVALIPRLWGAAAAVQGLEIAVGGLTVPILPLIIAVSTLGIMWQENFGGMRAVLEPLANVVMNTFGAIAGVLGSVGLNAQALAEVVAILAMVITVRFVASAVAAGVASLGFIGAQIALALALNATTASANLATVALGRMSGAMMGATATLAAFAAPITAIVVAIGLLVLNFDRVAQGVRVVEYYFVSAQKAVVDFLASLPFVGDAFKDQQANVAANLQLLKDEMAAAEADINAKAANLGNTGSADPLAEFRTKFENNSAGVIDATTDLVKTFGTTIDGVRAAAEQAGSDAMSGMAKGILEHQNAPMAAMQQLHDLLRTAMDPATEIAHNVGILESEELAAGLASGIPAVAAAAEAVRLAAQERLDELTDGAWTAGHDAVKAYKDAFAELEQSNGAGMSTYWWDVDQASKAVDKGKAAWDKYKPSVLAVTEAQKKMNEQLSATARSEGLSALNAAFGDIQRDAERFFDKVHQDTLRAIDDARKQKNAIIDAKEALIQGPVDAAQAALDYQRRKIEEWRLREAVANAQDPEAYRDAVLALQDFLAQQHINDMQDQADKQKDALDLQKTANDAKAEAQKEAENQRYEDQKERFERDLELLRSYLEKHPGEWQNVEGKIMTLLKGYGLDYKTAGAHLSEVFVEGLRSHLAEAIAAAKAYADLLPGMVGGNALTAGQYPGSGAGYGNTGSSSGGTVPGSTINYQPYPETGGGEFYGGGGGKPPLMLADGSFRIMYDNLLALLHKDEMVAPAEVAGLLRQIGTASYRPGSPLGGFATMATGSFSAESSVRSGAGESVMGGIQRLVVQIGDQEIGEIIDRHLAKQDDTYGERGTVTLRSNR